MNTSGRMTQDTVLFFAMREADREVAAAVGGVSGDRIAHALAVQALDDGSDFAGGYNEALADVRAILEGGKR